MTGQEPTVETPRLPSFWRVVWLSFALYLVGILPFIYWADSGELTLGGFLLGLSHPPSFPLYSLLLKAVMLLPVGDIAFKASLVSAFFGALSTGAVYQAGRVLIGWGMESGTLSGLREPLAWLAALLFACSGPLWQVSCRQEVYTLHLAVVCGLAGLLLQWRLEPHPRYLLLAGLLFGLGMGNHSLLMLATFPGLALWGLLHHPRKLLEPRLLAWGLVAFGLGLSLYLYLPLRSQANPWLDFNNPEQLSGFLDSFTKRREKGLFVDDGTGGDGGLPAHLMTFAGQLVETFSPGLVWLGVLGLLPWIRRDWRLSLSLMLVMALNVGSVVMGPEYTPDNPDIPGYLLLTYGFYALLLVTGLARLLSGLLAQVAQRAPVTPPALEAPAGPPAHPRSAARARTSAYGRLGVAVSAGVGLLFWWGTPERLPAAQDSRARTYGLMLLDASPPGALLLFKSDAAHFLTVFHQLAEGRRPDLTLFNRKGAANPALLDQLQRWDPGVLQPSAQASPLPAPSPEPLDQTSDPSTRKRWDTSFALEPELRAVISNNLPRRTVLWEPGSDNRWVVPLSRPLGPWLEVLGQPVLLTEADHRGTLAFQRQVWPQLQPGGLPEDPRAGKAIEVLMYNLCNQLKREVAASPRVQADAYGILFAKRPAFVAAGERQAEALEVLHDYPRLVETYARLAALQPENPRYLDGYHRAADAWKRAATPP